MEEDLITLETAKLAKEKGFNERCRFIMRDSDSIKPDKLSDFIDREFTTNSGCADNDYAIPTQPLLQKWLKLNMDYMLI